MGLENYAVILQGALVLIMVLLVYRLMSGPISLKGDLFLDRRGAHEIYRDRSGRIVRVVNVPHQIDVSHRLPERKQERKIDEKKRTIQKMGPKTFYYLDDSQVKDLYSQVSSELLPTQIETQDFQQSDKGLSASLKIIEPKYDKIKSAQTKKTYDLERNIPQMYNNVEGYLFEEEKVTFGLEEFDYDESYIEEFRSNCERMKSKFSFNVPDDLQNNFISDKIHGFVKERIKEISETSGYVVIQAEFSVSSVTDNLRVLTFDHPLNVHLSEEEPKVSFDIRCNQDSLLPSGLNTFMMGTSVKITCFGKVVRWEISEARLTINPIAIY